MLVIIIITYQAADVKARSYLCTPAYENGLIYEMLIFLKLTYELSLPPSRCLGAALPLQINLSYFLLGSRSSKLQLLRRPHTF